MGADEQRDRLFQVTGFIDELAVGLIANAIYWTKHPKVEAAIQGLCRRLEEYCLSNDRESLLLRAVDGCMVVEGKALLGASLSAPKVIRGIEGLVSGGIEFARGCRSRDFGALLQVLCERSGKYSSYREANSGMQRLGCRKLRFVERGIRRETGKEQAESSAITPEGDRLAATARLEVPQRLYQSMVDTLQTSMMNICCGETFEFGAVGPLVEGVLRALDRDAKAILNLSRYEEYDAFTFGHSIRVCTLAVQFARGLTDDTDLVKRIGVASVLHDVGKARLPFELLHSKSIFTPEERLEMQKHTVFGGELLAEMEECDPMAIAVAFGHHRTEDGRGYPPTAVPLPLSAATRIVKICDVYEALTAVRPYKRRVSPVTAYRTMLSMDGHFEPALLRRFIEINGIYPTGSRLLLSSGETAVVESQTFRPELPIVRIETTAAGDPLCDSDQRLVDLSRQATNSPLAVVAEAADSSAGRNELYTCSR